MLPCQSTCGEYHAGCHKTCRFWREYQREQSALREARRRYLQYHSIRCLQVTRQLKMLQPRKLAW